MSPQPSAETHAWASRQRPWLLRARDRLISGPRRSLIAGIVNINDDSFSGDGTLDVGTALRTAQRMIAAGADIIDVGGESARPNREAISEAEEIRRVSPFIEQFATTVTTATPRDATQIFPPLLSINTWRSEVAKSLLALGGDILNDMSALPDDSNARICASTGAALLIMHSVGAPKVDHRHVRYDDILETVAGFWKGKLAIAHAAGVDPASTILDPGIDFAKPYDDNLRIIRELETLTRLERPILMPISRKRVISEALGGRPAPERDPGTVGLIVACALRGASILRVHNVELAYATLRMVESVLETEDNLPG